MRKLVVTVALLGGIALVWALARVLRAERVVAPVEPTAGVEVPTRGEGRTPVDGRVVPVADAPRSRPITAAESAPSSAPDGRAVPPGLVAEGLDDGVAAPGPTADPQVGPGRARITGRVVDGGGAPLEGATAALLPIVDSHTGRRSSREPEPTFSSACDEAGAFRFVVPVGDDLAWELAVEAPGRGAEYRVLADLAGGTARELGEIVLQEAGVLRCRFLTDDGRRDRALGRHERFVAYNLRFPTTAGRTPYREVGEVRTTRRGQCRIEGVPAGFCLVEVRREWPRSCRVGYGWGWARPGEATDVTVKEIESGSDQLWLETRVEQGLTVYPDAQDVRLVGPSGARASRWVGGLFVFEGPTDERVEVRIDDPRFEPWSRFTRFEDGDLRATLRGTSRLVVLALDERTRAVIADVRTELAPIWPGYPAPVALSGELSRDGSVLYAGIPGGDYVATVRAPRYGAAEVEVSDLAPHEERSLVVLLSNGRTVSGRVRFPPTVPGALGARARVELFRGGHLSAGNFVARTGVRGNLSLSDDPLRRERFLEELEPRREHRIPPVLSEPDGTYELPGVLPGSYLVAADLGRGCVGFWALEVDVADAGDIDVELPETRRLVGRIDLPDDVAAGRFVVVGRSAAASDVEAEDAPEVPDVLEVTVRAPLDRHGRFESAPLPAGRAALSLRLDPHPSALAGDALSIPLGTSIELGVVDVPPNADVVVPLEELGERAPARVRVRCAVDGPSDVALVAEALAVSDPTVGDGARCAVSSDAQPGAVDLRVFPGVYRVRVRALDGSWCRWAPEPVELASGADATRSFELVLARGELRLVDADGAPLAGTEVWWWRPADDPDFGARGRTDAAGRLALTLPPGEVHVALPPDGDARVAASPPTAGVRVVRWSRAGPDARELRFERPAGDR